MTLKINPRIIEADDFGFNIMRSAPDIDDPTLESYQTFFRKSPALSMMAMLLNELIHTYGEIDMDDYLIFVHDQEKYVGLQILLNETDFEHLSGSDDDYRVSDQTRAVFDTIYETMAARAKRTIRVKFDPETNLVSAPTREALAEFLNAFFDDMDADVHGAAFNDPQKIHATLEEDEQISWHDRAEEALSKAWVIAALPERPFDSFDSLYKYAYKIWQNFSYSFTQIHEMAALEDLEGRTRPRGTKTPDYAFKGH
jgi:hypothetical protein